MSARWSGLVLKTGKTPPESVDGIVFGMLQTMFVWHGRREDGYESEQLTCRRNEAVSVCLECVPQATDGEDGRLESG